MIFLPYVDFMYQYDLRSQSWTQMKMEKRLKNSDTISFIPAERAFHSAQILGNYMVVFGGYSHKHNQVETCQDSNLYFFHLGCQNWVSRRILEHSPFGREYPKNQGLFGHSSAVRRKNMLIISGGYHGSISSDILAYTLPYGLSLKRNDKVIYYRHEVLK